MKDKILGLFMFLTLTLPGVKVFAQSDSDWRFGHAVADSMTLKLDTLSIIPQTFHLQDVDSTKYEIDPLSAILYLKDPTLLGKTLVYHYKVFTLDYSSPLQHKSTSLIEPRLAHHEPAVTTINPLSDIYADNDFFGSGSISRGISVGNNQDMVLNSGLDLRLSGKLSDDVEITAAITDQNIPIQPEGNTQVLQDFSKVFITLKYKDLLIVDAGDVELKSPKDNFLVVNRNLLGMNLLADYSLKKINGRMSNFVGGGVAKGRFTRQKISPQDGVQGPYKLYGANNEINMVIIAGSEKVYVDGVLLQRGQDKDYTIDYNLAEVTFTPTILMSSEKRVVIEFEYTDRKYSRYNIYTYNELEGGRKHKFQFRVNYFQEQDLKNQSIEPELDNAQKRFLAGLGDATTSAYYPYADSTTYNPERIQYKKIDTLVDGVPYYNVYVYSTDEQIQLYSVGFTYIGPHKGDYKLLQSTANGRVFGWVAPKEGVPQGDYSPLRLLQAPQLVQMATLAADVDLGKHANMQTELAISNFDKNTFSKEDDHDNVGFAYSLAFKQSTALKTKQKDTSDWHFQSALDWQFIHKNFHAVESFRNVEFARDYNLATDYGTARSDQFLKASIGFTNPKLSTTRYTLNWLTRFHEVNALRHELFSLNHIGRTIFNTQTSFLHSKDSIQKTRFLSSNNLFSYKFKKLEIGFTDLIEHNVFKNTLNDSLRLNSYAFNEARLFLQNTDSTKWQYLLSYKNRVEAAPHANCLSLYKDINEAAFQFGMFHIKNQRLSTKLTYRHQRLKDSTDHFVHEDYFLGNLEYTGRFFHNALVLNTYYEVGSGMELKKTFTFLKTAPGYGTHVWNDYNGNGIAEMGEFEPAAFANEADYIKVWLPGTDYINTYGNQFTQSIQLRPAAVWNNKKGFRRFLARFVNSTIFRTQHKLGSELSGAAFNPFSTDLTDTNLVSSDLSFNNTLSFNNSTSPFAFDFIAQERQGKSLLYYGFEQTANSLQQIVLKSAPCQALALQIDYAHALTENASEWLPSRCYNIEDHHVGTEWQLQFKNTYFGKLIYGYKTKRNLSGNEKLWEHRVGLEFNYRSTKFGTLTATAEYVYLQGLDDNTTTVSYLMLGGLHGGQNALWNITYQVAITEFLVLSFQYDGRISQGHKAIHTGNMMVKAQF